MTVRVSTDRDVRYAARVLYRLGFKFTGFSNSHPVFEHPTYGQIGLPNSPNDRNWQRAHRRELARRMGLTGQELEARIVGQAKIGKRGTAKRPGRKRSRPPRTLRHLTEVPAAQPTVTSPPERAPVVPVPVWTETDPITDERRAAWRRNAEELARLNAEERLRPRRAAA